MMKNLNLNPGCLPKLLFARAGNHASGLNKNLNITPNPTGISLWINHHHPLTLKVPRENDPLHIETTLITKSVELCLKTIPLYLEIHPNGSVIGFSDMHLLADENRRI